MANACDLYISPPFSRTWRTQAFPSGNPAVIRMSARELVAARQAWNFFELVETVDAATRVRLSDAGGLTPPTTPIAPPSIWFPLSAPGELMLYKRGQQLHRRVCPNYDWTSQRNLGISTTPILDVGPALCPDCSGGEAGADAIFAVEPTIACPPYSTIATGSTREITRSAPELATRSINSAPNSTPQNSTTPQTSTTPKTANTSASATPKTTTPHPPGTPASTTPKPASTPQPPSSPVVTSAKSPDTFVPSTPLPVSKEVPVGTPREVGSQKTTPPNAATPHQIGTPRTIGSARPTGSPLASGKGSNIGTPRQIGETLEVKSPSQIATPRTAMSIGPTRPASPPIPEVLIEMIVSEKPATE
jgi:hypothetical protein